MGRSAAPVVIAACAHCGRTFEHKPYMQRVFCSRVCFAASGRGGRKPDEPVSLACATCGRSFARKPSRLKAESPHGNAGAFCARACYLKPKLSAEEARRRAYGVTARWR